MTEKEQSTEETGKKKITKAGPKAMNHTEAHPPKEQGAHHTRVDSAVSDKTVKERLNTRAPAG